MSRNNHTHNYSERLRTWLQYILFYNNPCTFHLFFMPLFWWINGIIYFVQWLCSIFDYLLPHNIIYYVFLSFSQWVGRYFWRLFAPGSIYFRLDFFMVGAIYFLLQLLWDMWLIGEFWWTMDNFNTSCSVTNITNRLKISEGIEDLKNSVDTFNTISSYCRKHIFVKHIYKILHYLRNVSTNFKKLNLQSICLPTRV